MYRKANMDVTGRNDAGFKGFISSFSVVSLSQEVGTSEHNYSDSNYGSEIDYQWKQISGKNGFSVHL